MAVKPEGGNPTPEAQLRTFIDRFEPKEQKLFRAVRTAIRKRFPTANELAYDYPDSVVISYSPTERAIDAILAISVRADSVRLYLMHGPQLPDPKKLLQGSGKQTRFVVVEAASQLATPDVEALIAAALNLSEIPLPPEGKGKTIIRTDSAKPRPSGARRSDREHC